MEFGKYANLCWKRPMKQELFSLPDWRVKIKSLLAFARRNMNFLL